MSGPSGTPAPTGCVYLGAPVFGKPPIWTQQSRCTITDRRVSARCVGAAAGMGVQAIRCGTFLYRGWNRTREIQKPLVFGGVLFHISFAVERNMAAGGIEKKVVGPLRPKVTRARERGILFAGGSNPSAAGGGYSEVSEWPRSKFQAPAVRQRRNFGHRSSVPFRT